MWYIYVMFDLVILIWNTKVNRLLHAPVTDKIFFYCCRRFLKWRTRTLRRPWWPTTLPAWPNSEAEQSTCSSAITVNSRRIKRTPTTRSVAQQMMSPTPLRSVSYFSLHFFLASLNPGNGCTNHYAILAELTLFRFPPNTRSLFSSPSIDDAGLKVKNFKVIEVTFESYKRIDALYRNYVF